MTSRRIVADDRLARALVLFSCCSIRECNLCSLLWGCPRCTVLTLCLDRVDGFDFGVVLDMTKSFKCTPTLAGVSA